MTRTLKPVWIGGCVVLCLLCISCLNLKLKQPYPKKRHFILDVQRQGPVRQATRWPSLRLRGMNTAPFFEGPGFIYRTGLGEYESDFYNQFFAPPDQMITEESRDWLASSGLFDMVVAGQSHVQASYVLEVGIVALHGDFAQAQAPKAVLALEFTLSDDATGIPKILSHQEFREEVAIPNRSPEALIQGWNEALARILTALEEALETLYSACAEYHL
jgi:cholesterol transport system auxiliary component